MLIFLNHFKLCAMVSPTETQQLVNHSYLFLFFFMLIHWLINYIHGILSGTQLLIIRNQKLTLNPLKMKRRLLYLKTQFYHAVNTYNLSYKNQSVYAVSGTIRCLFSDKYKTHKYSVGRAYSCWVLNCWCITWPVGFKRLTYICELLSHLCPFPFIISYYV